MTSLLLSQADYVRTPRALETGRNIVERKIENCRLLLSRYQTSTRRGDATKADLINDIKLDIEAVREKVAETKNIEELLLLEARAANYYYQGIALVSKQFSWTRKRHGDSDLFNLLLNIGYHLLTLECEKALLEAGLYLEAGFVHGRSSGKPLLYDFVEVFRQPCVDRIILPLFSRKNALPAGDKGKAQFLKRFQSCLATQFWYKNRCETMRRIFLLEAYELKRLILDQKVYVPYKHRWGNSSPCNKKASPRGNA